MVPRSHGESRVCQGVTFKDAFLAPRPFSFSSHLPPRVHHPTSPLPSLLPKYLLNPSLNGRCFRCFERGHRAAHCREPRRCLLCMRIGHLASRCRHPPGPPRRPPDPSLRSMEPGPSSSRPSFSRAFLPSRSPPPGLPPLSACVVLVEVLGPVDGNAKTALSTGLAAKFGGSCRDFLVADFDGPLLAMFFPNWVARESAISRNPFRFEGLNFKFSNWTEVAELDRGHLRHKVWVRLCHWPILC